MTWIPRPLGEGLCYHVRVQCNNRAFRFSNGADFSRYLEILDETKHRLDFLLHHYVLMHTHVHLIVTTPGPALLNHVMRMLNQRYALDYHKRHHRYGHFWMNGYRCSVIDTDAYALVCMRYLDRNPLRAGLVTDVDAWKWGSHQYYAAGIAEDRIVPHPSYLGIGQHPDERRRQYRNFVGSLFPSDEMREREYIRKALRKYGTRKS